MPTVRHELTDFERGQICGASTAGLSQAQIASLLKFPKSIIQKVLKNPQPDRDARTGRPLGLSKRGERHILYEIRKNPKISYQKLR